ncbi:MAG: MarR family winged helix-turn-helix transcriptional regulator [Gemmatimonadaceae bacterium]
MARVKSIADEIQQGRPFRSRAQEATVALLRTASVIGRTYSRVLEPHGMSVAQYNALRIIRGAGTGGIPTLTIRERMIEAGTTITRLLDRLEEAGLITRERGTPDRRQVYCVVTVAGKRLLDRLDPEVDVADELAMAALDSRQLDRLVELLDVVRAANAERGAPRSLTRAE